MCGNQTAAAANRRSTESGRAFEESMKQATSQVAVDYAASSDYNNSAYNASYGWAHAAAGTDGNKNNTTSAYALANCWRTLNASECRTCLRNALRDICSCLPWSTEALQMNNGCFLRYSDNFFLNSTSAPDQNLTSPAPVAGGSKDGKKRVTLVAVALALLIIGAAFAVIVNNRRNNRAISNGTHGTSEIVSSFLKGKCVPFGIDVSKSKTEDHVDIELFLKNSSNLAPKWYRYSELKKITNSFSDTLGKGGFGSVYKGKLPDGRLLAVKLLNESKGGSGEEFMNEVASISRTSHINIVTLLGFCFESDKRALVYEFMPNGSLDKFLSHRAAALTTEVQLGLDKLFEIAVGVARGLEYLHQGCNTRILHLDIKPHNILLDKDMRPKISDFGLAKLCPDRASIISMFGARGTVGYIAPEVFCRNFGDVSHKADVYSFGMLLLEMVGGRKKQDSSSGVESSNYDAYFPDWIYKQLEVTNADDIVDEDESSKSVKRKLTVIGL